MSTDYEGTRREFLELLGQLGDPSFVRRAQRVQEAERALLRRCGKERDDRLKMSRTRLGVVAARIDAKWQELDRFVCDSSMPAYLSSLFQEWQPVLQLPVDPTRSEARIRRAVREMAESFEHFNRAWDPYVRSYDLTAVNKAREDYNRYYVIEKACAFQSEQMGHDGFEEKPPYTIDELVDALPCLLVPQLI